MHDVIMLYMTFPQYRVVNMLSHTNRKGEMRFHILFCVLYTYCAYHSMLYYNEKNLKSYLITYFLTSFLLFFFKT